jgi:FdhD protein
MIRYDKGITTEIPDDFPAEFPIRLTVNGRDIATLVASPHELRFLVAGFLRTQGFVREIGDFLTMGVCDESGEAAVRIRGELPERMTPVLTSGCGAGISFSFNAGPPQCAPQDATFPAEAVFAMMREMAQLSERYGRHGGIHSAAVSDGSRILLHAEDLGRHNTIDRLAGQALFAGIDLTGRMLLTSGRVSTEMAAKAASLGIALIASRTSPTDMAVRICKERGIGLAGYVRGESFRIAACPERLRMATRERFSDIAGVILAGGESSRMGRNKALLEVNGERMVETAYRRMADLFDEVLLVTNTPGIYDFIPCRKIADIYPGMGPLGGIHAALSNCAAGRAFVTACDMPGLNPRLIRELSSMPGGVDVVIPETPGGLEPLHAVYAKSCLPKMEAMLRAGERRILSFFDLAQVRLVPRGKIATIDPDFTSFRNVNTPEDYQRAARAD